MISIAAAAGEGMSGGPVINQETGSVVGVLTSVVDVDGSSIAFNWMENLGGIGVDVHGDHLPPADQLLEAHLGLGITIATAASAVAKRLETIVTD